VQRLEPLFYQREGKRLTQQIDMKRLHRRFSKLPACDPVSVGGNQKFSEIPPAHVTGTVGEACELVPYGLILQKDVLNRVKEKILRPGYQLDRAQRPTHWLRKRKWNFASQTDAIYSVLMEMSRSKMELAELHRVECLGDIQIALSSSC
jgi:hypothetical protein